VSGRDKNQTLPECWNWRRCNWKLYTSGEWPFQVSYCLRPLKYRTLARHLSLPLCATVLFPAHHQLPSHSRCWYKTPDC